MGKKGYTTFQWAIIVIGAILCFLPKYFISFEGLSASGVQVLFILIGGLLIWQCVGVDWSSLLVIFAMCFIPEMGPKTAFSSSMGNTTMIYLMLCFMLAASLQKTGVADRLAKWFITNKFSRKVTMVPCCYDVYCYFCIGIRTFKFFYNAYFSAYFLWYFQCSWL